MQALTREIRCSLLNGSLHIISYRYYRGSWHLFVPEHKIQVIKCRRGILLTPFINLFTPWIFFENQLYMIIHITALIFSYFTVYKYFYFWKKELIQASQRFYWVYFMAWAHKMGWSSGWVSSQISVQLRSSLIWYLMQCQVNHQLTLLCPWWGSGHYLHGEPGLQWLVVTSLYMFTNHFIFFSFFFFLYMYFFIISDCSLIYIYYILNLLPTSPLWSKIVECCDAYVNLFIMPFLVLRFLFSFLFVNYSPTILNEK